MSHRHPLITFLSFLVNARCILLIQTAVFITGNGLRARKRGTEEGSRRREEKVTMGRKKSVLWWGTRRWYFSFCLLPASKGAVVELFLETITLPRTHIVAACRNPYHLSLGLPLSSRHRAGSEQQKTAWKRPPTSTSIYVMCFRDICKGGFGAMRHHEQIQIKMIRLLYYLFFFFNTWCMEYQNEPHMKWKIGHVSFLW